jgi:aconitate hydratase
MWDREGAEKEERNTIVHLIVISACRMEIPTLAFLGSPELVTALVLLEI